MFCTIKLHYGFKNEKIAKRVEKSLLKESANFYKVMENTENMHKKGVHKCLQ